ncbi:hypothetical protein [Methanobacterium sp.]|uniref:hypothetical protein n=1 Tax=Methanobacterium sp. TaxID=2164 RepID=UPI003C7324E7
MMKSNLVKIIRNYQSDNEEIQEDVKIRIQSDVSFFDIDVDIRRLDYVIIPGADEPYVVDKVRVYDGRPPFHKEVILIKESEFNDNNKNIQKQTDSKKLIENEINFGNKFTVTMYLDTLEGAVDQMDIPKRQKNNLLKKIRELRDDPYIQSLNTTTVIDIKQILIG